MVADANWTTICPHCGAASEDDAICRACGKLLDEAQPIQPFSLNKFLSSCVGTSQFSAQVRTWNLPMKMSRSTTFVIIPLMRSTRAIFTTRTMSD